VLQERAFYRVGGSEEVRVDARVIAATHVNLEEEVSEGRFRQDLFYRLNVIEVRIPPLRERREDIPLLVEHFIERLSHEMGKEVSAASEGALKLLFAYDWPGNVRELENAVERAMATCRSHVLVEEDFEFLSSTMRLRGGWVVPPNVTLQELEKQAITATLQRTAGNIKESAALLGIDRSTLYDKIKRYEIER
jgi:DNA-binding NtrC family response regulator